MKPLSINQIFSALTKIIENAQELVEDAELLLENNRYARAFALAHLASEELVKFQFLLPVASELARNHNVNWKEINKGLRDHRVKIGGAILLNFMFEPPQGGVYQASELLQQMSTLKDKNDMKNFSLYASQNGHDYFKPSELIDEQAAVACVSRARELFMRFRMVYSALFALTGMTEEGLRQFIEMPEFQTLLHTLGSKTDLSYFPVLDKQHSISDITAILNDPTFQPLLVQFSMLAEQASQSLNQT